MEVPKKKRKIEGLPQALASVVLFVLVFLMMIYVHDIQGTARIVNYAGLVRGSTQRLVKLEIAEEESPALMEELNLYLEGIQNGSRELNLIHMADADYQQKVAELRSKWEILKAEIEKVRQYGYQKTDIVPLSEEYFALSDEMVGSAEAYSQRCATNIRRVEICIDIVIFFLVLLMLRQALAEVRLMRQNRDLSRRIYRDEATGLPNKNACNQLLETSKKVTEPTAFFMFDLNNLKTINDSLGHEAGGRADSAFFQTDSRYHPRGRVCGALRRG